MAITDKIPYNPPRYKYVGGTQGYVEIFKGASKGPSKVNINPKSFTRELDEMITLDPKAVGTIGADASTLSGDLMKVTDPGAMPVLSERGNPFNTPASERGPSFKKPFSETKLGKAFAKKVPTQLDYNPLSDASNVVGKTGTAAIDPSTVLTKASPTKFGEQFMADAIPVPEIGKAAGKGLAEWGGRWAQTGTQAAQLAKSAGIGTVASFIKPEEWLRSDKEGLRTEYGGKDVLGRGLQAAKGVGRLFLGDIGGVGDIAGSVIGIFGDTAEVKRDRGIFDEGALSKARKEMMSSRMDNYQKELEEELEAENLAREEYSKRARSMEEGGLISPGIAPYLSRSFLNYLSEKGAKKMKRGGMVYGPSHKQGGVDFQVGGQVNELEGGEAVINKKSTEMFKPLLSAMNQAGGGKSFAGGGLVKYY